jgi:hypothetical protein
VAQGREGGGRGAGGERCGLPKKQAWQARLCEINDLASRKAAMRELSTSFSNEIGDNFVSVMTCLKNVRKEKNLIKQ